MDLSPLIALAPGAAVGAVYWQRRRAGGDPLGPRPKGDLPDTFAALAGAVLLWLLLVFFVVPPLLRWTEGSGLGGFAGQAVIGSGVHVVIALAMLRPATRGPRRAVLPLWKLAAAGVLGAVVVFGVQGVAGAAIQQVYALLDRTVPGQSVVENAKLAKGADAVAAALAAIVMAPFAEEVFFRGLLMPAAARVTDQRTALALQALAFGAIHIVGAWHTWPLAIPLTIVGWGAGWFYLRTGSLVVPIVLHATFNAINFAALRAMN